MKRKDTSNKGSVIDQNTSIAASTNNVFVTWCTNNVFVTWCTNKTGVLEEVMMMEIHLSR
ncbi:MAG: hypothetical protein WA667_30285 [Candidatus Nitrosopolaris sp.]